MPNYNPNNEVMKREYFDFLEQAKRQNVATVDAVAAAIARFEVFTKYRDFRSFHREQAKAFKSSLLECPTGTSGKPLSRATANSILNHCKRFIQWLAMQPGYKSKIKYTDAEYFNLSDKDARIARAQISRPFPTIEEARRVILNMPSGTILQRRDRALVTFILLTGARDRAVISAKVKHVDLSAKRFIQDAREVKTKFSKTFSTYFFPVGDDIGEIFTDWMRELVATLGRPEDSPLFPATAIGIGENSAFVADGIGDAHWQHTQPVRKIFQQAFPAAGLPYCNPHGIRKTLAQYGQKVCRTPEQFKAWSQNLGHEDVLTTFTNYGTVAELRQKELISSLGDGRTGDIDAPELLQSLDDMAKAFDAMKRSVTSRSSAVLEPGKIDAT